MKQYLSLVCYVVQHISHLTATYLSVLNPLLDPNQLILGSGQHWHFRIPLEHMYQTCLSPLPKKTPNPCAVQRGVFFALKALPALCQMLNHSNIIRLMQHSLLGLRMPFVGVNIALFCPNTRLWQLQKSLQECQVTCIFQVVKQSYLAFQNNSWHTQGKSRKGILLLILVLNDVAKTLF